VIGDTDSQFTGIVVPTAGKNLLQVDFDVLPDTSGVFHIEAIPDQIQGCSWYSSDFANARDYANVPFGGGPAQLVGSVTIVPEPAAMLLVCSLLSAGAVVAILAFAKSTAECKDHKTAQKQQD
jgi:hypothetical protein